MTICPVCEQPTACDHQAARDVDLDSGFELEACPACGAEFGDDEDPAPAIHPACCSHENVDAAMDAFDPARESRTQGFCADCLVDVVLEYDEDEQTGRWSQA